MTTPKLQLPELVVGQSGKELTHNQALAILDQLTQATVVDKDLAAPPGSPANGSMYIVAAAATGAWSGQSGKLAVWLTTVAAWTFISPSNGWSVWVADEAKRYEQLAGVWTIVATGGMTNPMTTAGDLIVGGASGVPARLAKGAALQVLRMNAAGTAQEYADPTGGISQAVVRSISANETLDLAKINTFGVNSSSSNYTSTIPPQSSTSWTADAELHFLKGSSGTLTISASPGVTLNGVLAGSVTISVTNGAASIKRIALDNWWAGGLIGSPASTLGNPNLLYNSLGNINQRGYVSGTATTVANQYTIDRYRVVVSGQNLSFTASGNGFIKTAPAGGVEQVIEGINIAGGSYAISWSGTATATVNGTARANGEVFSLTANTNATVRFSGGTFQNEKVELGSVATAINNRPYGQELALCQRYYQTGYLSMRYYASGGGQYHDANQPPIVKMYGTPTVTVGSGVTNNVVAYTTEAIQTDGSFRGSISSSGVGDTYKVDAFVTRSAEL